MGTRYTTKSKLTWMWDKLEEQGMFGLGYSEKKLIAEFVIAKGTTRRTALDMIKTFEDADKIIRRDGKVYCKSCFNEDLSIKKENFEPDTSNDETILSEQESEILNANSNQ